MNDDELKQLETKMGSWQPRRPSPTLKWRLAIAAGHVLRRTARLGGLLIPAAACALLAMMNLNPENSFSSTVTHPRSMAMSLSNQNALIDWPALDGQGQNSPPAEIFKWTNASSSPSSMRSRRSGIN